MLAIAQSTLDFQSHIKKQRLLRKRFAQIRGALQVLYDIVSGQDLAVIDRQLRAQRSKYLNLTASFDPDIAETRSSRERAKTDRDLVLKELGYFQVGIMEKIRDDDTKNETNPSYSTAKSSVA